MVVGGRVELPNVTVVFQLCSTSKEKKHSLLHNEQKLKVIITNKIENR